MERLSGSAFLGAGDVRELEPSVLVCFPLFLVCCVSFFCFRPGCFVLFLFVLVVLVALFCWVCSLLVVVGCCCRLFRLSVLLLVFSSLVCSFAGLFVCCVLVVFCYVLLGFCYVSLCFARNCNLFSLTPQLFN